MAVQGQSTHWPAQSPAPWESANAEPPGFSFASSWALWFPLFASSVTNVLYSRPCVCHSVREVEQGHLVDNRCGGLALLGFLSGSFIQTGLVCSFLQPLFLKTALAGARGGQYALLLTASSHIGRGPRSHVPCECGA